VIKLPGIGPTIGVSGFVLVRIAKALKGCPQCASQTSGSARILRCGRYNRNQEGVFDAEDMALPQHIVFGLAVGHGGWYGHCGWPSNIETTPGISFIEETNGAVRLSNDSQSLNRGITPAERSAKSSRGL